MMKEKTFLRLLLAEISRGIRPGMPRHSALARADGLRERDRHDPILPFDKGGGQSARGQKHTGHQISTTHRQRA